MPNLLHLDIVTPKQRVLSEDVDMVVVPGEEGDFGVMAHHSPLVSMIRPGLVEVHHGDQPVRKFFVGGGYANVASNVCTVLAESLIPAEELEKQSIESEIATLKAQLDTTESDVKRTAIERRIMEAETKLILV